MKKILFFAAAMAAAGLVSCGNGSDSDAETDSTLVDDTIIEVIEEEMAIVPGDSAGTAVEATAAVEEDTPAKAAESPKESASKSDKAADEAKDAAPAKILDSVEQAAEDLGH